MHAFPAAIFSGLPAVEGSTLMGLMNVQTCGIDAGTAQRGDGEESTCYRYHHRRLLPRPKPRSLLVALSGGTNEDGVESVTSYSNLDSHREDSSCFRPHVPLQNSHSQPQNTTKTPFALASPLHKKGLPSLHDSPQSQTQQAKNQKLLPESNNQYNMSTKLSPTMKHRHGQDYNGSRPRSRAIAIKRAPHQGLERSGGLQDESAQAQMYDDCTWAMYLRITEYRQKHPVPASYQTDKRREGSPNRLGSETMSMTGRDHCGQESSRGVYFEDMDDEIFEMEL